ncbi:T-cell surface glycoprotein CD3 gamma chain-like isoform X2 [Stegostoma tigrinum]|uniref:T-cell surface glycoprotein CD3 gamma chain-like isoform X2 n=1 Tax=Stegostoma tigrinum TaxID=3053191 RepID=UPI00202B41D9|nr:T-cell surface glycoprotein CD3 gamma chain-like isoform X2 [Stegostoma tigrinum]XP_048418101.1 T-cell surface glycoprotein CD3 gamma chain-like isoform X2 [Stegostoma tigrinum]
MKCYILLVTVTAVALQLCGVSQASLVIKEQTNGIILECPHSKSWKKDGITYDKVMDNGNVILSTLSDSDSGEYSCTGDHGTSSALVFVRFCRNCVKLDPGTISGIVVGDIIATTLIALAVYFVLSSNKDKASNESEKQNLVPLDHNDLYQDLGTRRGSCEYSQLSPA